jgi:hypothetical protein
MNHAQRISLVAFLLAGVGALLTPRRIWREAARRAAALGNWLAAETPRSRATALIATWIVALVPMLHLSYLVRYYGVEVPTLDDWEMAPLIEQAHTGHFPWAQIFAQQQEARTVLPKLVFILSAAVRGHWDVRDLMMLSVVCCWLTAAGIFILLRRSGLRPIALAICFWLAVLTIFTPAKFEIWIFASGFPSFLPAFFLVTALVVIGSERFNATTKFVLCALLSAASTFTLANGLLAWGITFPVLLLSRPVPRWRLWLGAWLMTTTLCAAAYFWGYQKPVDLPAFAPAVSWMDYVRFALEFLGGGLTYAWKHQPASAATLFGGLQLALFLIALIYCLRRIRNRAFMARTWPWFALAAHSMGSAALATLGRVAYGASYALASRYVTFSIYLTIAVIALLALVVQERMKTQPVFRTRVWTYAICWLLVLAYLVPYRIMAFNTRFFLRAQSARDRLARAAVVFSQAIDTSETIKKTAYPNDARPVVHAANALDQMKLLRPPLVRTNQIEMPPHELADGRRASGACESVTPLPGNLLRATGWAVLDGKHRPADGVLVAWQSATDQPWTLCAISDSFSMHLESVKRGGIEQLWSAWSVTFPRAAAPSGARLSFWAVDAEEPRLYQLKDETSATTR